MGVGSDFDFYFEVRGGFFFILFFLELFLVG